MYLALLSAARRQTQPVSVSACARWRCSRSHGVVPLRREMPAAAHGQTSRRTQAHAPAPAWPPGLASGGSDVWGGWAGASLEADLFGGQYQVPARHQVILGHRRLASGGGARLAFPSPACRRVPGWRQSAEPRLHSVACRARHASPSCKPRLASLPTPSLEACRAGHGPGSLPRRTWWLPRAHGAAVVYAPGQRAAQAALGICTRRSGGGEGRGPSRQFRLHGDGRGAHVRRGDGGHVGGRCPRERRARRAGRAGRRALARQACAGRAAWLGCACVARERGAAQAADADAGAAGGLFPPGAGQSDWAGAVAGGRPRGDGIEMGSMGPSRQPGAGSRPSAGKRGYPAAGSRRDGCAGVCGVRCALPCWASRGRRGARRRVGHCVC